MGPFSKWLSRFGTVLGRSDHQSIFGSHYYKYGRPDHGAADQKINVSCYLNCQLVPNSDGSRFNSDQDLGMPKTRVLYCRLGPQMTRKANVNSLVA